MKAITADSIAGRVLQALRAPPGMTVSEAWERWPSTGTKPLCDLQRAGLVTNDGDVYTLTEAGRAACPSRNPLAAKPAIPEVFTMPKGETKLTRQQVLAAIVEAGAAGISRAALVEKFAHRVERNAVDNHIANLNSALPPVIYKPHHGHLVDIKLASAFIAAKNAQETASTATDDWIPEPLATDPPAAHDIHGISLAVDHHEVADLPAPSLAAQMAQIGGRLPAIVEDMTLDNPDTVEFAIYSSGGLDIFAEDCAITLQAPVLNKLRAFLGTLKEAA